MTKNFIIVYLAASAILLATLLLVLQLLNPLNIVTYFTMFNNRAGRIIGHLVYTIVKFKL